MTMSAVGAGDVWWVFLAAFVAGMAGALALAVRAGFRKATLGARSGFLGWFKDAVDEHVEPKFKGLRDEQAEIADVLAKRTFLTAEDLEKSTANIASSVEGKLAAHIAAEEGSIIATVREALGPLQVTVESHIAADAEAFERNDQANEETAAAVARIETLLNGKGRSTGSPKE